MKNYFEGKVVWITGASSGIGEALAHEFSAAGAKLIISSRKSVALEKVKSECSGKKENINVIPFDITWLDEIPLITKEALQRWGRVDYLILNAGVVARESVLKMSEAADRAVMETNYFGPVALAKSLLPDMIKAGNGHIVVISSLSGKYGVPKLSSYSASKHALHGFFQSLRAEVSALGIKVSFIIPGFINTPLLKNSIVGDAKNLAVNENGMSPAVCAKKMLRSIVKEKEEALIGGMEIFSVHLNRLFPKLFSRIIRNHPMRKLRLAGVQK